ncbi:hypothetical protein [Hymenobacter volaticus]|uniref:Helix-turn-helix domain-containing protein n=1 Tax=Hymenobacter volaticus TaxID=2932254 RepID=A0ABY4GE17_9BACT|nr:hypothetical protein [Hymenobacter volaticus]UOQ69001.1 hypothetical protein MUN86_26205 [Hymenobacter volaticus]
MSPRMEDGQLPLKIDFDQEVGGTPFRLLGKGLSVAETVELTSISLSIVKRYRKHLQAALT